MGTHPCNPDTQQVQARVDLSPTRATESVQSYLEILLPFIFGGVGGDERSFTIDRLLKLAYKLQESVLHHGFQSYELEIISLFKTIAQTQTPVP